MSKRTVYTTITPLPPGITRETVLSTLHDPTQMIDLNPLVEERHPIEPPANATPEEFHCQWYQITDRISYLPGGLMSGKVSYNACFHDLEWGVQTHCYAPMGLNIKGKWTLGGSLPGEPIAPVELGVGAPLHGLYLREDVDMKCNVMMTSFVKKTTKKAHAHLVDRLMVKSAIINASIVNQQVSNKAATSQTSQYSGSTQYAPSDSEHSHFKETQSYPQHPDGRDNSLYPQPLSSRNSVASRNSSVRSSTVESVHGRDPNGRVSWQALNPNQQRGSMSPPHHQQSPPHHYRQLADHNGGSPSYPSSQVSPPLHNQDPAYQQADSHRGSYQQQPPSQFYAELPSGDQRTMQGYGNVKLGSGANAPRTYHAELE